MARRERTREWAALRGWVLLLALVVLLGVADPTPKFCGLPFGDADAPVTGGAAQVEGVPPNFVVPTAELARVTVATAAALAVLLAPVPGRLVRVASPGEDSGPVVASGSFSPPISIGRPPLRC